MCTANSRPNQLQYMIVSLLRRPQHTKLSLSLSSPLRGPLSDCGLFTPNQNPLSSLAHAFLDESVDRRALDAAEATLAAHRALICSRDAIAGCIYPNCCRCCCCCCAARRCGGRLFVSFRITEPMERKNPNVAALLSMYCESVGNAPLGPAPPRMMVHEPNMKPIVRPTPVPIMAPIFIFCHVDGSWPPTGVCCTGTGIL